MPLLPKHAAAFLVGAALLASCDVADKHDDPAPSARIAVGDSLVAEIPGPSSDTSSLLWELHADSGRSYLVRWTDSGSSIAAGVLSATGIAQYVELRGPSGSWSATACFPATRSSTYRLRLTGFGGSKFMIGFADSSGLPGWVAKPDRWEYDDERSAASAITPDGSWQNRTLSTSGRPDVDWIRVPVDSGRTYTVAKYDSSGPASSLQLFSVDSVAIPGSQFLSDRKGAFLVRVAALSGRGGTYRIQAASTAGYPDGDMPKDEYENDNTLLTAKSIAPNGPEQKRTIHEGPRGSDADLIRIPADSGTTYTVTIRTMDGHTNWIGTRILGLDSVERPFRRNMANGIMSLEVPAIKPGPLFLEISTNWYSLAYTVAVTTSARIPPWAAISNNAPRTFASASTLPVDSLPRAFKLLGYDTNWIKIPVDSGFSYKIELDETEGTTSTIKISHFQLFDTLGIPSTDAIENENYYSPPPSVLFDSKRKGFRYLRLSPGGVDPSTAMVFAVRASRQRIPPDAFEPDNSMSSAALLKADGKTMLRSITKLDVDWIRIDLDSGSRSSIVLAGSGELWWKLFSRDSLPMNASSTKLADGRIVIDQTPLRSGPVYLSVMTGSSSPFAYSITTESVTSIERACDSPDSSCQFPSAGGSIWTTLRSKSTLYYSVAAKAGNTYRFHAETRTSAYFGLIDSTRNELSPSTAKTTSMSQNITYHAVADGTLRFWMKQPDYLGGYAEKLRGWLAVIADDPSEPGDSTLSGAIELSAGGSRSGTLTLGDRDMVKFHVDSGTAFFLTTTSDDTLSVKVYSPDSVLQKTASGPTLSPPSVRCDANVSGTWFAVLSGAGSLNRWTASLDTANTVGSSPNSGISSAHTLLPDGTPLYGRLLGKDVAWIAVPVDSGVDYDLAVESADLFSTTLFTADSLPLPTSQTQPILAPTVGSPVGKVRLRQSGKLFIRIEGIRTNDLHPTEYRIKVSQAGR